MNYFHDDQLIFNDVEMNNFDQDDDISRKFDGSNEEEEHLNEQSVSEWIAQNSSVLRPTTLPFRRLTGKKENMFLPYEPVTHLERSNEEKDIYFFQFPTRLPDFKLETPPEKEENEKDKTSVQILNQENKQPEKSELNANKSFDDTFRKIEPGCIGKIRIHQSGRVMLEMGNSIFELKSGIPCFFKQDAVSIDIQQEQYCVMGGITKQIICTPDIEFLSKQTKEFHS